VVAAVALTKTSVSPREIVTAPLACLAMEPVEIVIPRSPAVTEYFCFRGFFVISGYAGDGSDVGVNAPA
jgi:hypothetical protein